MERKARLGKRVVDGYGPEPRRYSVWDTEVHGFGININPSGKKTYVFRYRVHGGRGGRSREPSIGAHGTLTTDQAREIAKRWAAIVAQGGDPSAERQAQRDAMRMDALLDRYLKDHVARHNKPKTQTGIRNLVEKLIRPTLGARKVIEIQRSDIQRFHGDLSKTPYYANRALAALSKIFSLAELWGIRPERTNPCSRVTRYKETSRERYLTADEFKRLSKVLDAAEAGPLQPDPEKVPTLVNPEAIRAVRLTLLTGARIGEVLALRWEYINFEARCAFMPDSKTGKKVIQLPKPAMDLLQSFAPPKSMRGYVIRGGEARNPEIPLVNVKDPWGVLRVSAGMPDLRLHDLRHAFASVAVANGMSLPVIGALLGHKEACTTQRYAYLANSVLLDAADEVAERISRAMSKP